MPKLKKQVQKRDLARIGTWVLDDAPNSEYFRLTQIPEVLTNGKNGFLINGSANLIQTTDVLVELTDIDGNTIFSQPIKNYNEGLARVVSIEIYDDTPAGPALLTILGELAFDKNNVKVPDEWTNTYNVKWQTIINVAPSRPNTTPIRLYTKPVLSVSERLIPYRQVVTGSVTNVSTGSLVLSHIPAGTTFVGDDLQNQQKISIDSYINVSANTKAFNRDMVGGVFTGLINGSSFTSSIQSVVNTSTLQLSGSLPPVSGSPVLRATTNLYNISYRTGPTYQTSSLVRSYADISLKNLTTFTGDIQRAKFYVRGVDEGNKYELFEDILLEASELTVTQSNSGEQVELGQIQDSAFISQYWESGVILNSSYITTASVVQQYNSDELLDSIVLSGTDAATVSGSTSTVPRIWNGIKTPFSIESDSEYTFTADILCIKPTDTFDANLDIFLSGNVLSSGIGNEYGFKIASLTTLKGQTRRLFKNLSINFTCPRSDLAKLKFVTYGGRWYISNIRLLSARETGFNPDQITLTSAVVGRRFERLQFKAELFDANSNLVPLQIETDPIYFDGGNLVFRGVDNRIDGSITVAPSGSGPTLSSKGFYNTASVFTPGQSIFIGPSIPTVRDKGTAFFAGTSSVGPEISVGDKLYGYYDTNTNQFNLEIQGTILIVTGSNKFDLRNLFPQLVTKATITGQDINNVYVSASVVDPLGLAIPITTVQVQPSGTVGVSFDGTTYTISRPSGSNVAKVLFTGNAVQRRSSEDFIMVQPVGSFTGSITIPPFVSLVMVNVPDGESSGSLLVSTSINNASGTLSVPTLTVFGSTNVRYVNSLGSGIYEIGKPISGSGQVVFKSSLVGYIEDYDTVIVNNQSVTGRPALNIKATVTSQTSQNITVSCSVVDPVGVPNFTITTAIEPVTAGISVTGTNPYTVTRPQGSGSARVIFTATQPNRVTDVDPVTVPGQQLPGLIVKTSKITSTPTGSRYTVTVTDPIPENPIQLRIIPQNVTAIIPSTQTITLMSGATHSLDVLFPTYGSGDGRIGFTATSSLRVDGTDAIDLTETGLEYSSNALNTISSATFTATTESVTISATLGPESTAQYVEIYSLEFDTSVLSSGSAEEAGSQIVKSPFTRTGLKNTQTFYGTVPVFKSGGWVVINIVPVDGINRRGTPTQAVVKIPAGGGTLPSALTSPTNISTTTTTITNTVTMPASNLPTSINVYRDDSLFTANIPVTVGAGVAQSITHTGLNINTSYGWKYAPVNSSGEGVRTSNLQVSTANISTTLLAPSASYNGLVGGNIRFSITNLDQYPAGTSFEGDYNIDVGSFSPLGTESTTILSAPNPTSPPRYGTARFRAVRSGFTTSPNSPLINWDSSTEL